MIALGPVALQRVQERTHRLDVDVRLGSKRDISVHPTLPCNDEIPHSKKCSGTHIRARLTCECISGTAKMSGHGVSRAFGTRFLSCVSTEVDVPVSSQRRPIEASDLPRLRTGPRRRQSAAAILQATPLVRT